LALIVGLTGPNAAGKGEVAVYLADLGFKVHSLSDVIRDEARDQGLPPTREHLIRIGNDLRREGGPGVLAERIGARLGSRDVVDSIRNPREVEALRRIDGFVLLAVTAPTSLRFRRSLFRARPGDPGTLEQFEEREAQENTCDPRAQQLGATSALADHVVRNDGDIAALRRQVDGVLQKLGFGD
jgi:dCMP deaminase